MNRASTLSSYPQPAAPATPSRNSFAGPLPAANSASTSLAADPTGPRLVVAGSSASSPEGRSMRSKFIHHTSHRADRKVIEVLLRRLEKLVVFCRDPRVGLRNSPPYLLDILPSISEKLRSIMANYQGNLEELFKPLYFKVFLKNLSDRCEEAIRLFKEAKDKMYDDHSEARRKLTRHSLVLSHILKDLEAIFPADRYAPEVFRITKREAADWWVDHFGQAAIIPWDDFESHLFATFGGLDRSEAKELQNTVDLTCNRYVSIFEFDVFVRLFQPWRNVLETWRALTILHAGYMAFMTYDEVKAVLKKYKRHPGPGSYVYRLSCTKLGQWAIGYITDTPRILQTIIQNKSLAQALLDGERDGFYLYPNGTPSQSAILEPLVRNITQPRIQVSEEQHQLYLKIGSTFEVCKICTENTKNIRLEPCGHLLCRACLLSCQNTASSQTCPFCRLEVKSTEEVILDPFVPEPEEPEVQPTLPAPPNQVPEVPAEEETKDHDLDDLEDLLEAEEVRDSGFDDKGVEEEDEEVNKQAPAIIPRNSQNGLEVATQFSVLPQVTRRRNPSSCCSRATELDDVMAPSASLAFDVEAFMDRGDVKSVTQGPPLTREVAQSLLEVCAGNYEVAARVWQNFVPRS